MFGFSPKKRSFSSFFPDGMDRHCHILPGVDDGVSTMDEALALIQRMKEAGFRGAYCTPHIMQRFPNSVQTLQQRFHELVSRAEGMEFELHLAAEYMIDECFDAMIKSGEPLSWDGQHVLVEMPQYMLPCGWMDSISLLTERGYTPVLAHPERYVRLFEPEDFVDLSEQGILFQGNIGSFYGYYGSQVQALAQQLLKLDLYSCWGSDAHSEGMLQRVLGQ